MQYLCWKKNGNFLCPIILILIGVLQYSPPLVAEAPLSIPLTTDSSPTTPVASKLSPNIPFNEMDFLMYLKGKDGDPISMPTDVAVNKNGIYIVDGGNHRIVINSVDGKYRNTFGEKGTAAGQFSNPVGLGLDRQGNIYIADRENRRIQKFDKEGNFIKQIQVKSDGKMVRPIDVDVSHDGREIYVTGNRNHKIMVFNQKGKLLREWGGNGLNPGQFRFPGSIQVLHDGNIAAVDILNTRVQVFESSGTMLMEVGEWGVLPGQLFRPKGVAEGNRGTFYISDSYMDLIQVFSEIGNLLHVLKPENEQYKLVAPAGISIDRKAGRLYVAEVLKNRVAVFKLPL